MIGGIVINIEELSDSVRIDIVTDKYKEKHSVYLELTAAAKCIQDDDSLFFNSEYAFWSPRSCAFRDYKLSKISDSKDSATIKKNIINEKIVKD
jgi:hypothetical protein